jgi:acyl carrier protein
MEQAIELDQKVKAVLAEVLHVLPAIITDDLAMQDVDAWDSLKHMELIVSLENTFELQLSFDEIVNMKSVGDIKLVLEERGAAS